MVIATRSYCAALGKWASSDPVKTAVIQGTPAALEKAFLLLFLLLLFFFNPLRAATGLCFRIWPSNLCPHLMKSSSIQSKMTAIGMMVPMMERKWEYLYLSFRKLALLNWGELCCSGACKWVECQPRWGGASCRPPARQPARVSAASSEPVSWSSRFLIFKLWHSVKALDVILILGPLIPPPRLCV